MSNAPPGSRSPSDVEKARVDEHDLRRFRSEDGDRPSRREPSELHDVRSPRQPERPGDLHRVEVHESQQGSASRGDPWAVDRDEQPRAARRERRIADIRAEREPPPR